MSEATAVNPDADSPADDRFDPATIEAALGAADLNALRVALYQHTGDPDLLAMGVELKQFPGTPYDTFVVPEAHQAQLLDKARAYLQTPDAPVRMDLSPAELRELAEAFEGQPISESAARFAQEELTFGPFQRQARWSKENVTVPEGFEVLIVGAGFSAIITAIQLDALGIPWRIVERQKDWGGTWCLNTYPDARVDITNFIYSYTFEPEYRWKHAFAPREELVEYVRYLVSKYGLADRARFSTKVTDARWDEAQARWVVDLEGPDGAKESQTPNVLLSCSGLFSTPRLPNIPGIESFLGEMFHTTSWNHDYDHRGKRVALIGTGSTGSQLAPRVAEEVEHLTIYQRTPNWVTPVGSYRAPIPEPRQWLLRNMPAYTQWNRYSHTHATIRIQALQHLDSDWQAKGGRVNERNDLLRKSLTGMIHHKMKAKPELIPHLVPAFAPLSRRIVVDNGFYDTLLRDNVHLDVTGIEEIQANGILGKDGVFREYDLIILAAGFDVESYLHPVPYKGRDNMTLEQLWSKDGARAYLTMTLPHYPNFFMMYGPNAAVRASSFHSAVEMLSRYICEAIASMIERGASSVAVKQSVHDDYNQRLDAGMKGLLWEQEKGGNSYYLNQHGKSGVNMPWEMYEFYDFIREPDPADFEYR